MRRSRFSLAATLATVLATASFALAQGPTLLPSEEADAARRAKGQTYIVQLIESPAVAYEGGLYGMAATKPAKGKKINPAAAAVRQYTAHLTSRHDDVVSAVGGSKLYSYCFSFNGFAARLTRSQVAELRLRGDVVQVWQDELMQPTTNTSPAFLGLDGKKGVWKKKKLLGEDIVVGVIDTGIWPEHDSFDGIECTKSGKKCEYKYKPDVKANKLAKEQAKAATYGPAPAGFSLSGCAFGNAGFNSLDVPFACNNKLLAARHYAGGFSTAGSTNPDGSGGDGAFLIPGEYLSARDNDGHGSHTGSTAAGNVYVPASIGGGSLGTVSGMAPRARVAAYKVCWNGTSPPPGFQNGCFSSDSMAAIDQAVADGVDVINFSIGGSSTNFNGPDDVAFLFAAGAGVFVATSAGNAGPGAQTIGTPSGVPWITAVGMAQDDQVFGTGLDVSSPGSVAGTYEGLEGAGPITLASTGDLGGSVVPSLPADGCLPLTNGAAVNGNIALVIRGACSFVAKYDNAAAAGATALVVYNDGTSPTRVDPITMSAPGTTIPGIMIGFFDGDAIATAAAGGTVTGTVGPSITVSKENTIAGLSSRGPNAGAPDIIKPDIAAPGVQILAAQTPTPNDGQTPGEFFQVISGTSMASPHAAGVGALLLQKHPDWTPAMVRSALMTTARQDINKTFGDDAADPFDIGAGHIVPSAALDPGLVYDADLLDYVRFTCGAEGQPPIFSPGTCNFFGGIDSSDLNLPSIGVAELVGTQTVTRTVTSVQKGGKAKTWTASVDAPPGIDVTVTPSTLSLENGESASYQVALTTDGADLDSWAFGSLTWSRGGSDDDDNSSDDSSSDDDSSDDNSRDKKSKGHVRSPIAVKPVALSAPESVTGNSASGSLDFDVAIGFNGSFSATAEGLEAAEVQPDSVGVGGATLHFVFVPPGTRYARFSLFDSNVGDGTGSDDLDLQVQGPDSAGFPFVAFSGSATSEEEINLVDPDPGFYAVFVIHFATVNPVTDYDLFFWDSGPDLGNMTVTAPSTVSIGTETIGVSWSGLTAGVKYLGGVLFGDSGGDVGRTVVRIDP